MPRLHRGILWTIRWELAEWFPRLEVPLPVAHGFRGVKSGPAGFSEAAAAAKASDGENKNWTYDWHHLPRWFHISMWATIVFCVVAALHDIVSDFVAGHPVWACQQAFILLGTGIVTLAAHFFEETEISQWRIARNCAEPEEVATRTRKFWALILVCSVFGSTALGLLFAEEMAFFMPVVHKGAPFTVYNGLYPFSVSNSEAVLRHAWFYTSLWGYSYRLTHMANLWFMSRNGDMPPRVVAILLFWDVLILGPVTMSLRFVPPPHLRSSIAYGAGGLFLLGDFIRIYIRGVRTYGIPLLIETASPGGEKPDGRGMELEQTAPNSTATIWKQQAAADQKRLEMLQYAAIYCSLCMPPSIEPTEEWQDTTPSIEPDDKPKGHNRGLGILACGSLPFLLYYPLFHCIVPLLSALASPGFEFPASKGIFVPGASNTIRMWYGPDSDIDRAALLEDAGAKSQMVLLFRLIDFPVLPLIIFQMSSIGATVFFSTYCFKIIDKACIERWRSYGRVTMWPLVCMYMQVNCWVGPIIFVLEGCFFQMSTSLGLDNNFGVVIVAFFLGNELNGFLSELICELCDHMTDPTSFDAELLELPLAIAGTWFNVQLVMSLSYTDWELWVLLSMIKGWQVGVDGIAWSEMRYCRKHPEKYSLVFFRNFPFEASRYNAIVSTIAEIAIIFFVAGPIIPIWLQGRASGVGARGEPVGWRVCSDRPFSEATHEVLMLFLVLLFFVVPNAFQFWISRRLCRRFHTEMLTRFPELNAAKTSADVVTAENEEYSYQQSERHVSLQLSQRPFSLGLGFDVAAEETEAKDDAPSGGAPDGVCRSALEIMNGLTGGHQNSAPKFLFMLLGTVLYISFYVREQLSPGSGCDNMPDSTNALTALSAGKWG